MAVATTFNDFLIMRYTTKCLRVVYAAVNVVVPHFREQEFWEAIELGHRVLRTDENRAKNQKIVARWDSALVSIESSPYSMRGKRRRGLTGWYG